LPALSIRGSTFLTQDHQARAIRQAFVSELLVAKYLTPTSGKFDKLAATVGAKRLPISHLERRISIWDKRIALGELRCHMALT